MKRSDETCADGAREIIEWATARNPDQPEFIQAACDIVRDVWPLVAEKEIYRDALVLQRLLEPDRVLSFRVTWERDDGSLAVNRGYRVQTCNALGPYKGGLRFHPGVNESVLKFLGLEQVLKNSLTGLPIGAGKGGADFDPKGHSESEIRRFCHAFMEELGRHIGSEIDVPAGDIGVGAREIGYLFGQYKRMGGAFEGALTGKPTSFGGSELRQEATGFGVVQFASLALDHAGESLEGKRALVSGAGNVARYCALRLLEEGATVLTLSNSGGTLIAEDGLTPEHLEWMIGKDQRLEAVADQFELDFEEGTKPWNQAGDLAFPCATQNELTEDDAQTLTEGGVRWVVEGANMPCTDEAIETFKAHEVAVLPGKAANAGGVTVSVFEMSQNATFEHWTRDDVEQRLKQSMRSIHDACVAQLEQGEPPDYIRAANRAGFLRVADALVAQGR